ncbi:MAG: hypothetical protein M1839_005925 [Geoglossum umbratile]|nr:MAG: hypothetical protein M1839_005925 [Geoglossum umbratile]
MSGTNAFGFSTGPFSNAEGLRRPNRHRPVAPMPSGLPNKKHSTQSKTLNSNITIAPPPNTEDSSSTKSSPASGTNAFGFRIAQPLNVEESSPAKSSPASGTNAFGFNIAPPSSAERSSPASHAPIFGGINPFGFTVNPSSGEGTADRTSVFGRTNPFEFKVDPPKPSANHLPKFGESKSFNTFEFNFNPTTNGGMSTKSSSTSYVFGGGKSTDSAKSANIFFSSSVLAGAKPAPKSVLSLSVPPTATSSNTSGATTPGATTDAGDSASESAAESGLFAGGDTPVGKDDSGYHYTGESDEDVLF